MYTGTYSTAIYIGTCIYICVEWSGVQTGSAVWEPDATAVVTSLTPHCPLSLSLLLFLRTIFITAGATSRPPAESRESHIGPRCRLLSPSPHPLPPCSFLTECECLTLCHYVCTSPHPLPPRSFLTECEYLTLCHYVCTSPVIVYIYIFD